MDIDVSFDEAAKDFEDDVTDRVKQALGALAHVSKLFVKETKNPTAVLNGLTQLIQVANAIFDGSFTPDGMTSLLHGTPLALGTGPATDPTAGSPDTDAMMATLNAVGTILGGFTAQQVVDFVGRLFGELETVDDVQKRARVAAIGNVVNGSISVKEDGTPGLVDDLSNAQRELGALHRQVDPLITPLDGLSATDKDKRTKGMLKIAEGTTAIKPNGDPDVPDVTTVTQERDNAIAMLADIKSNGEVGGSGLFGRGSDVFEIDLDDVQQSTKTFLTS